MLTAEEAKLQMCDIGRRIYNRGYSAANEGNLSIRLSEHEVLCTPTMHCKGFMTPDDIATVDMEGNQLAGARPRSSEVLMHLTIMKARPDIKAIVHCHPPHATAFAVAREPIPAGIIPEVEVFLGEIPLAPYTLPGTVALGESILPFVDKANIVLLANHGTVSYDATIERAYWWTEILDNYCRMLINARVLGRVVPLSRAEALELIANKHRWGMSDPRTAPEFADCDPRELPMFGHTWKLDAQAATSDAERPVILSRSQLEDLVATAVERALRQLRG